jgi:hypothetical protein
MQPVESSREEVETIARDHFGIPSLRDGQCKPDEKADQELQSGASKEVPAVKADENDTDNDDVVYEVDRQRRRDCLEE